MRTSSGSALNTWFQDEDDEEGMFDDHAYMWRHLIEAVPEKDFVDFTILDYGCNRGVHSHPHTPRLLRFSGE